jgi:hypothetical protein
MLKLNSISPSRIKTFDTCKFKYWLTYHRPDVKLKSNFGASHGTLLHDILEHFSNDKDKDWVTRLYKGYAGKLETINKFGAVETLESPLVWAKIKDYQDKKPFCDTCPYATKTHCSISQEPLDALTGCPRDLFDNSISMIETTIGRYIKTWKNILKDSSGVPIGTEYSFKINVAGTDVPMIGVMDLVIERDKDTIHIIDYKTGVSTQNYEECLEDIQVKMYSLASRREFIDDVNGKGYKYKNVILTFDYFTNKPITLSFTKEQDDATEEEVAKKIHQIQSTDWITRIVKSNKELQYKSNWKCMYLCDNAVCAREWKGEFKPCVTAKE